MVGETEKADRHMSQSDTLTRAIAIRSAMTLVWARIGVFGENVSCKETNNKQPQATSNKKQNNHKAMSKWEWLLYI